MDALFIDENDKVYYPEDIYQSLKRVGADDCESLFIHSDIMFGSPVDGFSKKAYISILVEILESLGVKNIIVPTFTYSFCNGEDYDVVNSKSLMGALSEYYRKKNGRFRTKDPLLSISVPNELKDKFRNLGNNSLGENSGLDVIHHMDGVKFLFFGAPMEESFTYVHYVEKMLDVPYRFDISFNGRIINSGGDIEERNQSIHTACKGAKTYYPQFEDYLFDKGLVKRQYLGNKKIICVSEHDAYREIKTRIQEDEFYFLERAYIQSELEYIYTWKNEKGKITHC